jgi:hypothetical protein
MIYTVQMILVKITLVINTLPTVQKVIILIKP